MTAVIILGAIVCAPRANITTIDNDITAWFSKEDPVYRDYERFRAEFGGTRSLIVALAADSPDRIFSRDTLQFIEQVSGDIERVDTVNRVDSLASATIVKAIEGRGRRPRRSSAAGRRGLAVSRASAHRRAERRSASRRSRLGRRQGHRDRGQLRRRPHRQGTQRRDPEDPRHHRSAAAAGRPRLLQRQPRNQRDLQPDHARQPAQVHPSDFPDHDPGAVCRVSLLAQDGAGDVRRPHQHPVDARSLLLHGIQLQRPVEHARAAGRRAGDCRRRAHDAALGRGEAAGGQRGGVQGNGCAPGRTALRRQCDDRARDAVARHQQCRRRPLVRHRFRRRDHGRLRDLARARADAAHVREAVDDGGAAREVPGRADAANRAPVLLAARGW